MKPGDRVTREQAYRLPNGAVLRDWYGVLWTCLAPRYKGGYRYWRRDELDRWSPSTGRLFRVRGPLTLVSLPASEPVGDGS